MIFPTKSKKPYGTEESLKRTENKYARIQDTFKDFSQMVEAIKRVGKDDTKFENGRIGVKGPSSVRVAERNWQFYRLMKLVADSKGSIDTTLELNNRYEKEMHSEFLTRGTSKGYNLSRLEKKPIEWPDSGWFGFPLIKIERTIGLFPKQCENLMKTLRELDDPTGFQKVVEKLFSDLQDVIEVESIGTVLKIHNKLKK